MKRIKFLVFVGCILSFVVLCKLIYLSIIDSKSITKQALAQRTENIQIKSPRGIIYDRNMIKITSGEMGIIVKDKKAYYIDKGNESFLSHIIGYTSPDGGGYGLESAFDKILNNTSSSSFSYLKDINNNKTSQGYKIDIERTYKGIALTIDYHIQKIVENVMDEHKTNGAVIVADCKNGEILAMASRPNFDRNNLEKYLDGQDGELINRCITSYNPGSVFKIIVTAAALEEGINEDKFYNCNGKSIIDGAEFVCHNKDGHGMENLTEAFSNSCNSAFYEIGNEIGTENIFKYSNLFGICDEVLKINGIKEDVGNVPKTSGKRENANISIGQGDVMVTPLQIADVLCTICNGGVRNQMSLIYASVNDRGDPQRIMPSTMGRVISNTTARKLLDLMRNAVKKGTGSSAEIVTFGSGGKTGSAETGWAKDGEVMQHGWFAGFFPSDNPRYVCVVLAENGKSGTNSACPLFSKIGTQICNDKRLLE